ncbi:JKAMP (predicted) [Pycnogonum litorale]
MFPRVMLLLLLFSFHFGVCEIISRTYSTGPVIEPTRCPGLYCGRVKFSNDTYSGCTACPRGSRPIGLSVCTPCNESPLFYDWMYLGFMAVIPLVLHWFCIDRFSKQRSFTLEVLAFHAAALFEIICASILTLLAVDPKGQFRVTSCHVERLSDWYTLLHNPSPGYINTLHCTQEAVYPLYTMVFIYYIIALVIMLVVRLLVVRWVLPEKGRISLYIALYFMPCLLVIHAIFGGLIYYSFPYITIIMSVFSSAVHFAFRINQSMKSLVTSTFTDLRNVVILIGHWMFHAYGIIALTELKIVTVHGPLLLLIPLPAVFYVVTSRCTNPEYASSNV